MKKRYRLLLVLTTMIIVGGIYVTYNILPYMIIKPYRVNVHEIVKAGGFQEGILPADYGLSATSWTLEVEEGITLHGFKIDAQTAKPLGTFVLLHGIGGCKEHMLALSAKLTSIGYNTIIYDARAHGESGGVYCTYGAYEVMDIQKILNNFAGEDEPFAIWGNSLGGAVALQALAKDKRLKLGIIESTFSDLSLIVYEYQKSFTEGIGLRWISDAALHEAGKIAAFNPKGIVPKEIAKQINQPIFIAHGNQDEHINIAYGRQNYESLTTEIKFFYEVEGGNHVNLWKKGGEKYEASVLDFIKNYMPVKE